ncbi:MAG: hypothetical protein DCF22_17530 [Leptolyngbya sp.]|nr:MAG: hypothetical protein DCF22_17530 [Leptolyngbya sp.]
MSYFKQIASRARPTSPGRSQSLPLLNPTQALFRPVALVEPLELPDERLGSDESERVGYAPASTISSATQSISSSVTATSAPDSSDVPSPAQLPSLQRPAASSHAPDLQRDSPPHLVPIKPTEYSGSDRQPAGRTPISLGHQASANSVSASNLTTEIAQPLRTTLEPKHSTQSLPTERMAESPSQLPPPSFPGTSKPDKPQRSTIHIGAIDIQITPPPVTPQPLTTRPVATSPTGSLSRGFTSGFGLRQG